MNEKVISFDELNEIIYKQKKTLKSCSIEIINVCNFKCSHCYMPCAKKQIMEFQTFKKIVDQLIDLECLSILITGGEVFLNPQFKEMYLYAKKKGFIVSINTNGSLLNDDLIDLFAKYKPFSIEISLYGYDNESYYNFTGIPNSFNIVNKNILKLKQENINVKLKSVLTKKKL